MGLPLKYDQLNKKKNQIGAQLASQSRNKRTKKNHLN